jgi:multidrug transporter EmrE-like cation transporter
MANLFLAFTIFSETGAVLCMKLSEGFQNKLYTLSAILLYGLSFAFLTLTLKYLPAGIANGIWAAASTVLVAVLGYFIFNERLTVLQTVSLVLIVFGLIGLGWKI